MDFGEVFLWFMAYSFLGWVYETVLCSCMERRFVYRGFLNGPYCPIYGCGALLDIAFLGRIDNPFLLFLAGAALTCTLEYFTGYAMEKLFHARWWDYSDRKFNIQGRVCLLGAFAFGSLSVLLIKYMHPFLKRLTGSAPPMLSAVLSILLAAAFCADFAVTLSGFVSFNKKLSRLSAEIIGTKNRMLEIVAELPGKFNLQERRMLRAFPKLSSLHYNDALTALRERLRIVGEMRRNAKNKDKENRK